MADTQEQLLNEVSTLGPTDFVRTVSSPTATPDSTVMKKSNFIDRLFSDSVDATISGNTDNLNTTGLVNAHVIRLSSTGGPVNVTGLQTGVDGRIILIHNVGAPIITLVDESASSLATNRFALTGNIPMSADTMVVLQYDGTSQRWRAAGGGGGGAGGHTIQDAGSPLSARSNLNFIGAGVTASDNAAADATDVTVVIDESTLATSDVVTGDANTSKHGFMPKLHGSLFKSFRGNGAWVAAPNIDAWIGYLDSAYSYVSANQFQVSGDVTPIFRKGVRLVWSDSGGWKYGTVLSATYSAPNTQVIIFTNNNYMLAPSMANLHTSDAPLPNGFPSAFDYTPSLSGVTLGNGTVSGKFFVIGSQVFGSCSLMRGSTSNFTGNVAIGYPCALAEANYFVTGNVSCVDAGTALYTGIHLNDGTIRCMNTAGTFAVYAYVGAAQPFTWAAGDFIEGSFRYRF